MKKIIKYCNICSKVAVRGHYTKFYCVDCAKNLYVSIIPVSKRK